MALEAVKNSFRTAYRQGARLRLLTAPRTLYGVDHPIKRGLMEGAGTFVLFMADRHEVINFALTTAGNSGRVLSIALLAGMVGMGSFIISAAESLFRPFFKGLISVTGGRKETEILGKKYKIPTDLVAKSRELEDKSLPDTSMAIKDLISNGTKSLTEKVAAAIKAFIKHDETSCIYHICKDKEFYKQTRTFKRLAYKLEKKIHKWNKKNQVKINKDQIISAYLRLLDLVKKSKTTTDSKKSEAAAGASSNLSDDLPLPNKIVPPPVDVKVEETNAGSGQKTSPGRPKAKSPSADLAMAPTFVIGPPPNDEDLKKAVEKSGGQVQPTSASHVSLGGNSLPVIPCPDFSVNALPAKSGATMVMAPVPSLLEASKKPESEPPKADIISHQEIQARQEGPVITQKGTVAIPPEAKRPEINPAIKVVPPPEEEAEEVDEDQVTLLTKRSESGRRDPRISEDQLIKSALDISLPIRTRVACAIRLRSKATEGNRSVWDGARTEIERAFALELNSRISSQNTGSLTPAETEEMQLLAAFLESAKLERVREVAESVKKKAETVAVKEPLERVPTPPIPFQAIGDMVVQTSGEKTEMVYDKFARTKILREKVVFADQLLNVHNCVEQRKNMILNELVDTIKKVNIDVALEADLIAVMAMIHLLNNAEYEDPSGEIDDILKKIIEKTHVVVTI